MDREMLEGVIMELDVALDRLGEGDIDFEVFAGRVAAVRDRLNFVLDNTPDD